MQTWRTERAGVDACFCREVGRGKDWTEPTQDIVQDEASYVHGGLALRQSKKRKKYDLVYMRWSSASVSDRVVNKHPTERIENPWQMHWLHYCIKYFTCKITLDSYMYNDKMNHRQIDTRGSRIFEKQYTEVTCQSLFFLFKAFAFMFVCARCMYCVYAGTQ